MHKMKRQIEKEGALIRGHPLDKAKRLLHEQGSDISAVVAQVTGSAAPVPIDSTASIAKICGDVIVIIDRAGIIARMLIKSTLQRQVLVLVKAQMLCI